MIDFARNATYTATIGGFSASTLAAVAPRATAGDDTYDALNPRGRRRSATTRLIKPEDLLLTQHRRDRLDANALDVWRNMSLLAWMIRRTLDYCCLWDFQPQTTDDGLNKAMRQMMTRDCQASQLDYVGRMDWDDMRRVAEALKILTGDMFFVPLAEGTLQAVEGSYCRSPQILGGGSTWVNGARLNGRGRIVQWNFRELKTLSYNNYEYTDRQVAARNVWQHVQYEGRLNQIRGFSPIAAILNECRDIYETFDHARAKVKLDQLFGVAIFRNKDDEDDIAKNVDSDGNDADNDDTTPEEHYDFGAGPVVMDRTVGESVELLSASNPAQSTQEFLKLCIQVALKALDLPYNFFGSRAAWNLYERSCWARRQTQLRLHQRMTGWRRQQWFMPVEFGGSGELTLKKSQTLEDIGYRWVPRGLPWWKPDEELGTNLAAVAAGLKTMQGVCDENNLGLYAENLATLQRERDEAAKYGFVMQFNPNKLSASLQPSNAPVAAGGQQ